MVTSESEKIFSTISVVQNDGLRLVVLDVLARPILVIQYDGKTPYEEQLTPPGWNTSYSHNILVALLLNSAQDGYWMSGNDDWKVESEVNNKKLVYKGTAQVTLHYIQNNHEVIFRGHDLKMIVRPLSRQAL